MYPALGNAVQFGPTILKCISGNIPPQIKGNYFRNGVAKLNIGKNTLSNYFSGDGCILKLSFQNGKCSAQMKHIDTPLYRRRQANQNLGQMGFFKKLWLRYREGSQAQNPANTSVLFLKNSPKLLALCQGGQPFVMSKQDLKSEGFTDFGWMKSAFSAHPKVDPDNGDIYNIGMSPPTFTLMRSTKDMQKICQTQFKYRQLQSIHDICLAGDYVVFFEGPIRFNLKGFVFGDPIVDGFKIDQSLPTLVHIYSKKDLKHVKTISCDPFYSFHFTNGFSDQQKIVVQYFKYDMQTSKTLFQLIGAVPKLTQPQHQSKTFKGQSVLQQMTISLKDFSIKTKQTNISGDFPVCQDNEVGKQWKYTYCVGSESGKFLLNDIIYKYDRKNEKIDKIKFEQNSYVNEPCLIRVGDKLYLLVIVNNGKKTYTQIVQSQSMKSICRLQMPQYIPGGFHGKWDWI